MVSMPKRQQSHQDENCQLKATHWSSMNNKELLIPPGRWQLAPKHHYTQVQQNSYAYRLQKHKSQASQIFMDVALKVNAHEYEDNDCRKNTGKLTMGPEIQVNSCFWYV